MGCLALRIDRISQGSQSWMHLQLRIESLFHIISFLLAYHGMAEFKDVMRDHENQNINSVELELFWWYGYTLTFF